MRSRAAEFIRRAVAASACLAAAVYGLAAAHPPAARADVVASGPVTSGMSGKCLDGFNMIASSGVILYDCNGSAAQNWSWDSTGTLSVNGYCLDIQGDGTANGTPVDLWYCNGGGNQQWEVLNADELYNPQSGRCLDDPGWSTANGTQLEIWDCGTLTSGTDQANQDWYLPAAGSGNGFVNQGGNMQESISIGNLDPNLVANAIQTTIPESLGLPDNSSINDILQAEYDQNGSLLPPEVGPPPSIPDATVQVIDGTINLIIPSNDIQQVSASGLPAWGASIVAVAVTGVVSLLVGALCAAAFTPANAAVGFTLANWQVGLCAGVTTFVSYLAWYTVYDAVASVPFNNSAWETIAAGVLVGTAVAATASFATPWLVAVMGRMLGTVNGAIRGAITFLAGWIADNVGVVAAVTGVVASVAAAVAGVILGNANNNGMATPVNGPGTVNSAFSNKCMDDLNGAGARGDVVDLYDCNGSGAQQWTVWSNGTITNNGECLDTTASGATNGTTVTLDDCNGDQTQVWSAASPALQNPNSGRCLTVPGGVTDNGTQLDIEDCDGSNPPSQGWTLPQ